MCMCLYVLVEIIGWWLMFDVFVVILLVGFVYLLMLVIIKFGFGVGLFVVVVVLIMFVVCCFDFCLIWDVIDELDFEEIDV